MRRLQRTMSVNRSLQDDPPQGGVILVRIKFDHVFCRSKCGSEPAVLRLYL